ncbi:hypothetical protein [Desulfosediminicola flagellatus]|nr:hypothetical protein [Desulfosediminicola flagellatus]
MRIPNTLAQQWAEKIFTSPQPIQALTQKHQKRDRQARAMRASF